MAALPPDPRTLGSWEDAFQYPLPVVRRLEQQLRQNIDENRQKLRSLVGASYRDLLGTAERIIEMDEQMQTVEANIGDIGRKCDARAVERVGENHARMRNIQYARHADKYRAVAQTKVLQSTLSVISRTIKGGGDALLAAKLLVLARLLHKSVSESSEAPPLSEDLRRKLTASRKRLMSYIERVLVQPTSEKSTMVNPLCAYALVTSSTPRDVLRHFLQTRYGQLETSAEVVTPENVVAMIGLYSQTLSDTRELFPRLFADGLSGLGKTPLLRDPQVRATHELNLDIYDTWIAEDVRAFMPWLRHDHLTASEVIDGLSHWSEQAQECLLQALTECLQTQTDARAILKLRHDVLSLYLKLSSRIHNSDSLQVVQAAREAFLRRLEELAMAAATVEDTLTAGLDGSIKPNRSASMWDLAKEDMDLSGGALDFRQTVIQHRHGHDDQLQSMTGKLDVWLESTNHFWDTVNEMRATKWMDDLDDDMDDLPDGDSPQVALSRRDPDQLQLKLREANTSALERLYEKLQRIAKSSDNGTLLLRLWRELDQRRGDLGDRLSPPDARKNTNDMMRELHRRIAAKVLTGPMQDYRVPSKRQPAVAEALWDGSPPLPVQPSEKAFKLLTTLHKAMYNIGTDVWSPAAVGVLKAELVEQLQEQGSVSNGSLSNGRALSNADAESNDEAQKDAVNITNGEGQHDHQHKAFITQTLFDMLYLQRITSGGTSDKIEHGLHTVIQDMHQQVDLDGAGYQRLLKSANEYWKRTYLLFGLLAPGSPHGM